MFLHNSSSHIKDIGGYIFFSKNTMGRSGRPVKIHTDLFLDFFSAVDPASSLGQSVIRDIESLKIIATSHSFPFPVAERECRPGTSQREIQGQKKNLEIQKAMSAYRENRRERPLNTSSVRAFYHIHQKDEDKCPTVYISEIQILRGGKKTVGGLYEKKGASKFTKVESSNLEGKTVVISGATNSLPKARENAEIISKQEDVPLFYCPDSVAEDLGIWKKNRLTSSTKKLAKELEKTIKDNQKRKVSWIAEGEGAALLAHAVKAIPNSLETHSFKFYNARANLPALLQDLTQKNARLEGEFIDYELDNTQDRTALLAMASHNQKLVQVIGGLPRVNGYDDITRRYLKQQIEGLGIAKTSTSNSVLSKQQSLRGGSQTFVDLLLSSNKGA